MALSMAPTMFRKPPRMLPMNDRPIWSSREVMSLFATDATDSLVTSFMLETEELPYAFLGMRRSGDVIADPCFLRIRAEARELKEAAGQEVSCGSPVESLPASLRILRPPEHGGPCAGS